MLGVLILLLLTVPVALSDCGSLLGLGTKMKIFLFFDNRITTESPPFLNSSFKLIIPLYNLYIHMSSGIYNFKMVLKFKILSMI